MRSTAHTLTAIVIIVLLNAQAFATQATWAEGEGWNIVGNSERQDCRLSLLYDTADMIVVYTGNDIQGPAMGFSGRNLRPLTEGAAIVEANLTFSNGQFHRLVAKVLDQGLITADVPVKAVLDFANTSWMEVRVRGVLIGAYNLTGTRRLVEELGQCVLAMGGKPS